MLIPDAPQYAQISQIERSNSPRSKEQIPNIPKDVFEPDLVRLAYLGTQVIDRIPPFEEQVRHSADELYRINKLYITGNKPLDSLSPAQVSELDQLDAGYKDIKLCLERNSKRTGALEEKQSPFFQVPVSSAEMNEILTSIRSTFGMTVKDLADVLRVERQTIYAWIRSENKPSLENSRRIRAILSFAKLWGSLCRLPAKTALRAPLDGNHTTLLELLAQDNLDDASIRRIIQDAASFVNESKLIRPSAEQILLDKGLDPVKYRISDSEFDAATGNTHFSSEDWE